MTPIHDHRCRCLCGVSQGEPEEGAFSVTEAGNSVEVDRTLQQVGRFADDELVWDQAYQYADPSPRQQRSVHLRAFDRKERADSLDRRYSVARPSA